MSHETFQPESGDTDQPGMTGYLRSVHVLDLEELALECEVKGSVGERIGRFCEPVTRPENFDDSEYVTIVGIMMEDGVWRHFMPLDNPHWAGVTVFARRHGYEEEIGIMLQEDAEWLRNATEALDEQGGDTCPQEEIERPDEMSTDIAFTSHKDFSAALDEQARLLETPITELSLRSRLVNNLKRLGVDTVGDLLKDREDNWEVYDLGPVSKEQIGDALLKLGITESRTWPQTKP